MLIQGTLRKHKQFRKTPAKVLIQDQELGVVALTIGSSYTYTVTRGLIRAAF
jgi:hypothetical protein